MRERDMRNLFLAGVLIFNSSSCLAQDLKSLFPKISLYEVGSPKQSIDAEFLDEGAEFYYGAEDFGIKPYYANALISAALEGKQGKKYIITFKPKQGDMDLIVEQASASSLFISGEGPTLETNISASSPWQAVKKKDAYSFIIERAVHVIPKFNRNDFLNSLRKTDPGWVETAKRCTNPTTNPCVLSTYSKFRVFSLNADGKKTFLGNMSISLGVGC